LEIQDWNVGSLTGWEMREVSSVPEVMKGSVMHRLFQRAFPGFFAYNSLHLWQPFHIPAMNYLLAKMQGKLADMEDLAKMGVETETIKKADKLVKSMGDVFKGLGALDSQIKPLEELEEKRLLGYTNIEIKQIQELSKAGKDEKFIGLQLAFKPWKRLIKMPETRFEAPKATAIYISNYSTIVDEILAKRNIYKNPGFLDDQVVPKVPLRDILTGRLDKGLAEKVEGLLPRLRSMVTQEKEQVFMDYFTEKAQDYLSSGRRDYQMQKAKVGGKEKDVQVWQIDIVSEYVPLRKTLKGYTLIGLLICCV